MIDPLELLKQNAPSLFKTYVKKKIVKLEKEISDLRARFKEEKDEKIKKEIVERGVAFKNELNKLKKLIND